MADQNEAPAAEAPAKTKEITIQNIPFTVNMPYAAGHVLNAAEADSLNQTRAENLRNNFASTIKAKLDELKKETPAREELDEAELEALRTQFDTYEASYEFQGRRAGRAPLDPVKREATKMARETITAALKAKNLTPAQLVEGKMDELIQKYLEGHPEVTDEAKRRVEAVKSLATDALDGVDLEGAEKPAATPAEVAPSPPEG